MNNKSLEEIAYAIYQIRQKIKVCKSEEWDFEMAKLYVKTKETQQLDKWIKHFISTEK